MRKFYACSVCKPGDDYCQDNFNRIINNKGFVLHDNTTQKGTYRDIKVGDVLLLKYNKMYVAYGKVIEVKITGDDGWNHWAYIDEWIFQDVDKKYIGVDRYGIEQNTIGGGKYGTVKTIINEFAFEKIKLINNRSTLFKLIEKEFKKDMESINIEDKIEILEYKKQIILQGPPGTGKTRLAKMIAEKMTNVVKKISPIQVINDFFENYATNEIILNHRKMTDGLVNKFVTKFSPQKIINLPLEDYALGREEKDGFCYWLEYVLKATGKYNGPADKGKIYFNTKDDKYIKSGFLQNIDSDSDAMKEMAIVLDKVVNQRFDEGVNFQIGRNFVLKTLNTYYPETYFPINSEHCINNVLKIFGVDYTGLNYIEKNKNVQSLFLEKKKEFNSDITNYEFMYFLFNTFNLKKEVKLENNEILIKGDYKIIQFHPSYSYEDFVRGITAKTTKEGIAYEVEDRILIQMAEEAFNDPNSKYILIIDEINRANLPSVLGELIYALEYRYNHKKENYKEACVESLYDKALDGENSDRDLLLPDNLYIIGTMNTADRSVGHVDYAIKRRFAFVNILPEIEPVHPLIKDVFIKISSLFIKGFNGIVPKIIEKSDSLASDFRPEDIWIGHSYFICKKNKTDENEEDSIAKPILNMKLKYEIIPLLQEYIKDGILNETEQVKKVMDELISTNF